MFEIAVTLKCAEKVASLGGPQLQKAFFAALEKLRLDTMPDVHRVKAVPTPHLWTCYLSKESGHRLLFLQERARRFVVFAGTDHAAIYRWAARRTVNIQDESIRICLALDGEHGPPVTDQSEVRRLVDAGLPRAYAVALLENHAHRDDLIRVLREEVAASIRRLHGEDQPLVEFGEVGPVALLDALYKEWERKQEPISLLTPRDADTRADTLAKGTSVVAILGLAGSGKSSLLRMLTARLRADSDRVWCMRACDALDLLDSIPQGLTGHLLLDGLDEWEGGDTASAWEAILRVAKPGLCVIAASRVAPDQLAGIESIELGPLSDHEADMLWGERRPENVRMRWVELASATDLPSDTPQLRDPFFLTCLADVAWADDRPTEDPFRSFLLRRAAGDVRAYEAFVRIARELDRKGSVHAGLTPEIALRLRELGLIVPRPDGGFKAAHVRLIEAALVTGLPPAPEAEDLVALYRTGPSGQRVAMTAIRHDRTGQLLSRLSRIGAGGRRVADAFVRSDKALEVSTFSYRVTPKGMSEASWDGILARTAVRGLVAPSDRPGWLSVAARESASSTADLRVARQMLETGNGLVSDTRAGMAVVGLVAQEAFVRAMISDIRVAPGIGQPWVRGLKRELGPEFQQLVGLSGQQPEGKCPLHVLREKDRVRVLLPHRHDATLYDSPPPRIRTTVRVDSTLAAILDGELAPSEHVRLTEAIRRARLGRVPTLLVVPEAVVDAVAKWAGACVLTESDRGQVVSLLEEHGRFLGMCSETAFSALAGCGIFHRVRWFQRNGSRRASDVGRILVAPGILPPAHLRIIEVVSAEQQAEWDSINAEFAIWRKIGLDPVVMTFGSQQEINDHTRPALEQLHREIARDERESDLWIDREAAESSFQRDLLDDAYEAVDEGAGWESQLGWCSRGVTEPQAPTRMEEPDREDHEGAECVNEANKEVAIESIRTWSAYLKPLRAIGVTACMPPGPTAEARESVMSTAWGAIGARWGPDDSAPATLADLTEALRLSVRAPSAAEWGSILRAVTARPRTPSWIFNRAVLRALSHPPGGYSSDMLTQLKDRAVTGKPIWEYFVTIRTGPLAPSPSANEPEPDEQGNERPPPPLEGGSKKVGDSETEARVNPRAVRIPGGRTLSGIPPTEIRAFHDDD